MRADQKNEQVARFDPFAKPPVVALPNREPTRPEEHGVVLLLEGMLDVFGRALVL